MSHHVSPACQLDHIYSKKASQCIVLSAHAWHCLSAPIEPSLIALACLFYPTPCTLFRQMKWTLVSACVKPGRDSSWKGLAHEMRRVRDACSTAALPDSWYASRVIVKGSKAETRGDGATHCAAAAASDNFARTKHRLSRGMTLGSGFLQQHNAPPRSPHRRSRPGRIPPARRRASPAGGAPRHALAPAGPWAPDADSAGQTAPLPDALGGP